jgi:hypothetical protein
MLSVVTVDGSLPEPLGETAASIAAQDRSDIQHIVVAASDPNRTGRAEARNEGLRRATGSVVAFLDAGDCLQPGAAAKVMGYFAASPGVRVVYGRAALAQAPGEPAKEYPTRAWNYDALQCEQICCRPAMFWRRDIAVRFGVFDERLQYAYDYEYWLRVGAHTPFAYQNEGILASYAATDQAQPAQERLRAFEEILDVVAHHASSDVPLHAWLRKLCALAARLSSGGQGMAGERYRRAYATALLAYGERFQIPLPRGELSNV